MTSASPFINAFNRGDPLQAPLASMEDLSVAATPMGAMTPMDETPGVSPRTLRARWSVNRSSIGSQLDPLIEDVVVQAHPEPKHFREVEDMIDDDAIPVMTSTPLKAKHIYQKRAQSHAVAEKKRFASPSRLHNNLAKRQLVQQQNAAPVCNEHNQQFQQQSSLFPHNYSDAPPPLRNHYVISSPPLPPSTTTGSTTTGHPYFPNSPYEQQPPFRTCDPIQECPEEPMMPDFAKRPRQKSAEVAEDRILKEPDHHRESDVLLRLPSYSSTCVARRQIQLTSSRKSLKNSKALEEDKNRNSLTSSLTGIGTNSSVAGFWERNHQETGYRVGPAEEFVFPGGIPKDRLARQRQVSPADRLAVNCLFNNFLNMFQSRLWIQNFNLVV
jgi:hypothetical protein